jgi:hypothetical protein
MRKVFLITGFNNWGKTTLLYDLFGVKAFRKRSVQHFAGYPFLVLPNSNDDLGEQGYIDAFNDRLTTFQSANGAAHYIASAFCPTRENWNDSDRILRTLYCGDTIHMLLLEHKWCGHAKLQVGPIQNFYANQRNLTVHVIGAGSQSGRLNEVQRILLANLP